MNTKHHLQKCRVILTGLAILAICGFIIPQDARATSAGATIFNEASVTYDFGAATGVTQKSTPATVTVDTLAAAPTVSVAPLTQTTVEGGSISYVYTITSNSNGPDTYSVTAINSVDSAEMATASTESFSPDSITLWGGIIVACAGVAQSTDEVCLPAGAETGLAGGETVMLNGNAYTVGTITAGTAEASGSPEVTTNIQLVDDITSHGVTADTAAAGDPVGEYGSLTMDQTAGTLADPTVPGTHTTNIEFTTTGTDLSNSQVVYLTSSGDGNEVITTVASPQVTFDKTADVATAKPGETITYTLTITNNDSIAISNIVVTDTAPVYTTYQAGTTQLNAVATTDITAGVNVGTLNPTESATITFEVVVDP